MRQDHTKIALGAKDAAVQQASPPRVPEVRRRACAPASKRVDALAASWLTSLWLQRLRNGVAGCSRATVAAAQMKPPAVRRGPFGTGD